MRMKTVWLVVVGLVVAGCGMWMQLAPVASASHSKSRIRQTVSSRDGVWQTIEPGHVRRGVSTRLASTAQTHHCTLNRTVLARLMATAPMEFSTQAQQRQTVMTFPMPDGSFQRFQIEESPIFAPELAAQFPEFKTYHGQGIDDPTAMVRFDWTSKGFHAMVWSAGNRVVIDPEGDGNTDTCVSYYSRDLRRIGETPQCEAVEKDTSMVLPNQGAELKTVEPRQSGSLTVGRQLQTFRLALGATGEYTRFHGGTVEAGLAAMTTTVNRINGIYSRELAVRLMLIPQETAIIYTDPATDPYSGGSSTRVLDENQINLDRVIGEANYDVGHVFTTGGGGVAALNSVCASGRKARGLSGLSQPIGDVFDVDFVAHEIGHQFGGNHPFNGSSGSCSGNRAASAAYEPGSGSTIMAYAGICSEENLQNNSDDYFHSYSFQEIQQFLTQLGGNSCASVTETGNTPPTVSAGSNFTIPRRTPFTLTATGSDADGDALTYCWEQLDLGPASPPNEDDGQRPIFRSFRPTTSPSRTFPQLNNLLRNQPALGESLPTTNRILNFRVTVRDNRTVGGVSSNLMRVNVTNKSGPFEVTSPNVALRWQIGTAQNVTWNVAGTTADPVNCALVNVRLSTDGGLTYPIMLVENTANDGTEPITVPNIETTQARIKIEAVGNIFFDVSNADITLTTETVPTVEVTAASFRPKRLTVTGAGFGLAPVMIVNGVELPESLLLPGSTENQVTAKGGRKKLSLRKGANTIQIKGTGGQLSNVFGFQVE